MTGAPLKFPKLSMKMEYSSDVPADTEYRCEGPDWIAQKSTDRGKTWVDIGRLDPPRHAFLRKEKK